MEAGTQALERFVLGSDGTLRCVSMSAKVLSAYANFWTRSLLVNRQRPHLTVAYSLREDLDAVGNCMQAHNTPLRHFPILCRRIIAQV